MRDGRSFKESKKMNTIHIDGALSIILYIYIYIYILYILIEKSNIASRSERIYWHKVHLYRFFEPIYCLKVGKRLEF